MSEEIIDPPIVPAIVLFVISSRFGGQCLTRYEGLDETTVETLMTESGHEDIEFVDQETYETALAAALEPEGE